MRHLPASSSVHCQTPFTTFGCEFSSIRVRGAKESVLALKFLS